MVVQLDPVPKHVSLIYEVVCSRKSSMEVVHFRILPIRNDLDDSSHRMEALKNIPAKAEVQMNTHLL
jgi:hypothetical protein